MLRSIHTFGESGHRVADGENCQKSRSLFDILLTHMIRIFSSAITRSHFTSYHPAQMFAEDG